jgi:hypothetical protein
MNARIEKDFYFQAAVHFEDKFYINSYDITLSLLVETDSIREQNIAMDRVTHFLSEVLQNSILVYNKDKESIDKYRTAGLKVCELPEEPYDQILSMILIQKLNTIMEDRLKITDMVLGSVLSDGVRYSMVAEVAEAVLSGNHWWNKSTICISNSEMTPDIEGDNIVKLFNDEHWADLGLTWKEKAKK